MKWTIASSDALEEIGSELRRQFPAGATVGLVGDLGVGKTEFVRRFIATLAQQMGQNPPRVPSPSFPLHLRYEMLKPPVEHLDLYRLEEAEARSFLDSVEELLGSTRAAGGFIFIEWPGKANGPNRIAYDATLSFTFADDQKRTVTLTIHPV